MGSFTPQVHSRPKLSLWRGRILLSQLCLSLAFAGIFVATTTTLLPPAIQDDVPRRCHAGNNPPSQILAPGGSPRPDPLRPGEIGQMMQFNGAGQRPRFGKGFRLLETRGALSRGNVDARPAHATVDVAAVTVGE